MSENCIFCDYEQINDDILWESKNFFIKVGKGILTPGHVLLISKKHFSCFGEMPEELETEFNDVKKRIIDQISKEFSEPLLFEQGVRGQSIAHAHIHILPTKNKEFILPIVNDKVFPELEKTKIKDIKDIRDIFSKEKEYIYLGEKGEKWIFHSGKNKDKKFAFRRALTDINGNKEFAYWQKMNEESKKKNQKWVEVTKKRLKKFPIHQL